MQKFFITILVFMFYNFTALAQNQSNYDTSADAETGSRVFKGKISFTDLSSEATFTWLKEGENDYHPDARALTYLQEYLKDYDMVVFMGTWCSDSHELIPKLKKLLETIHYPVNKMTMYGVDRAKTTKSGDEKLYSITLVPTIILLKDGKEYGRITETVTKSLEEDLEAIIEKMK